MSTSMGIPPDPRRWTYQVQGRERNPTLLLRDIDELYGELGL